MCSEGIVHNRFVSKKQSVARKMWMTECAQTKCGQSGCVVTRRMTIEIFSKRRVRNREGVETDVVDTKCAQSSCVEKRGCLSTDRFVQNFVKNFLIVYGTKRRRVEYRSRKFPRLFLQ